MGKLTSAMFGDRGRRRAEKLGIDPARLPPGQSPTEKWPVLTVGPEPEVRLEQWSLAFYGEVEEPYALRWDELLALPQVEQVSDLHCVTRWSRFDQRLSGVRVRELLECARPRPGATHALIHAYGGYSTNLPLDALRDDDVLIAVRAGDEPLPREHGGPARLLVPSRYLWKSGIGPARPSSRSSCSTTTSPASGSATATTTTGIPGRSSGRTRTRWRSAACGGGRAGWRSPSASRW